MSYKEECTNDFELASYFQSLLISKATGHEVNDKEYEQLRYYFLGKSELSHLLPTWIRTNRDLSQYWQFIKYKFPTYQERRDFIWSEFLGLLNLLEAGTKTPIDYSVSEVLKRFNVESVHSVWSKALERRQDDPDGAITMARTLLETVCKHILDEKKIAYEDNKIELPQLYHLVSTELVLAPSKHTEEIFKQILGSCSSVVNGLGTIRNRLGDAHGTGMASVRPSPRHAELAVNLAGSVAMFLVETWENQIQVH